MTNIENIIMSDNASYVFIIVTTPFRFGNGAATTPCFSDYLIFYFIIYLIKMQIYYCIFLLLLYYLSIPL
jgi:hypothetical protein